MTETIAEQAARTKADQWRERIAEQERTGVSVKQFCKQQGLTEYSFYAWRKRLRRQAPVRFALVERGVLRGPSTASVPAASINWPDRSSSSKVGLAGVIGSAN